MFKILILTLFFISPLLIAQVQFIDQDISYPIYECCSKYIESFNQLPANIQKTTQNLLENRLGNFSDKLQFHSGYIINTDEYFNKYSESVIDRKWVLPAFDLYFTFADSTLNIKRFVAELKLDKYGQLLSFNLPHLSGKPRIIKFIPMYKALEIANKYAKENKFLASDCIIELNYGQCTDALFWKVGYIQSKLDGLTKKKVILINVDNGEIENELEELELSVH